MKKYIKILGLATMVIVQSCEGQESEMVSENSSEVSTKVFKNKDHKQEDQDKSTNKGGSPEPDDNSIDTGDDDEPRKDKSHWRIAQDTIW